MKKIHEKEGQITFSLETDESLTNSIRRYIGKIPLFAIDEIEIIQNDSPLYDETIAQRMGLIPLKMPTGKVKEDEVSKFKLTQEKEGFIMSGEIKGDLRIVYENIPITFLNKNQGVEIKATARIGRGNEHSKFSPGFMFYRNSAEITLDKEFLNEIKEVFPKSEIKEKGNKIVISDNQKTDILDFCEGLAQKKSSEIEVKYNPELIVTVESFGQITPEEILQKAIEELRKDLNEFSKKISKE